LQSTDARCLVIKLGVQCDMFDFALNSVARSISVRIILVTVTNCTFLGFMVAYTFFSHYRRRRFLNPDHPEICQNHGPDHAGGAHSVPPDPSWLERAIPSPDLPLPDPSSPGACGASTSRLIRASALVTRHLDFCPPPPEKNAGSAHA